VHGTTVEVDLREKIRTAIRRRGYTHDRLLLESGLECDVSSLNRKINGLQALEGHEARALAAVLHVRVSGIDAMLLIADRIGATAAWPAAKRRGA